MPPRWTRAAAPWAPGWSWSTAPPTPVGMTVTCESELTAVEGRKLVFKVSLHDEKGPVGGGVHERFIINNAKFAAKAEAKKG